MCKPASFKVVKGPKALWSKTTDSHNEIETEHGLPVNAATTIFNVSVEITPPPTANGFPNWNAPLKDWVFRVDQDMLPKWWDAVEAEKEVREELKKWVASKLIRNGDNRNVKEGDCILAIYCGGTVNEISGGTVGRISGGTVSLISGGTVRFTRPFETKIRGSQTVVIDSTSPRARCIVGTDVWKTVRSKK